MKRQCPSCEKSTDSETGGDFPLGSGNDNYVIREPACDESVLEDFENDSAAADEETDK